MSFQDQSPPYLTPNTALPIRLPLLDLFFMETFAVIAITMQFFKTSFKIEVKLIYSVVLIAGVWQVIQLLFLLYIFAIITLKSSF